MKSFVLGYDDLCAVLLRDYSRERGIPDGAQFKIKVHSLKDIRDQSFGGVEVELERITPETERNVNVN